MGNNWKQLCNTHLHIDNEDFDIWDLLLAEPSHLQHIMSVSAKAVKMRENDPTFPLDPHQYVGSMRKPITKGYAVKECETKELDKKEPRILHKLVDNIQIYDNINELFNIGEEDELEGISTVARENYQLAGAATESRGKEGSN